MIKIAVITTTRAEYGLLAPVIRELRKAEDEDFRAELIVSGTHLSSAYGMTIDEIRADRVRIDYTIPISVESSTEMDISRNQAETLIRFTKHFARERYAAILLLGDRYEVLSIAIAAGNTRIPIFHMCGGDTTEGAADEWIRHSITKMSYLHFVTNETSRHRVIQLGESPERVYNYGSTSIDNILTAADMTKEEVLSDIGLEECRYLICTYHPVTLESISPDSQILELLEAVESLPDLHFIFTKSNADYGGARLNELLDLASIKISNLHVYASLGVRRYLSLMKHAEAVLGNSSSGIIETPSFGIPTINIGDRQRGRLRAESVINCKPEREDIIRCIRLALSQEYQYICRNVQNPYGDGGAAKRIAHEVVRAVTGSKIDLKKTFYDIC